MPISCDPNDLATAATCFSALSWRQRQQIRVYLLCTLVNGDTPVDCTPSALATAAACFNELSAGQLDQIETYLFCQLASGGGGGGGGNVVGPASSTDGDIVLFDGVTGKLIKDSGIGIGGISTIYSSNGTLAADRTVTCDNKKLHFNGYNQVFFDSDTSAAKIAYLDVEGPTTGRITLGAATTGFATDIEARLDSATNSFSVDTTGDTDTGHLSIRGTTGCILRAGGSGDARIDVVSSGVKLAATGQKIGAFGAAPVVQPASADQAVATDPASTMTLSNALRSALVDLGWIKGSA